MVNLEKNKVILEKQDGIGFISLNDPENRNSLMAQTVLELNACLDNCAYDSSVRVIVLRGKGEFFSAGGNVKSMLERVDAGTADYRPGIRNLGLTFGKLREIRKPVIASMQGAAAGGGLNLALGCDFRIAAADTKFVFAFVNIGLIPDCGGALPLVNMVGVARATELLMLGRTFSAQDAHEWGLLNEVVPVDNLEAATLKLATKLANGPTTSYGCIKAMINRNVYDRMSLEIDEETQCQDLCSKTADHREGIMAFVEKRKPIFIGR